MIKENQKILNDFNIFSDGIAVLIAMIAAYAVRFFVLQGEIGHITLYLYIQLACIVIPLYLMLYAGFGLYESFRNKRFTKEIALIIQANFFGIVILLTCLFIFKLSDLSRWTLILFSLINTTGTASKRFAVRFVLKNYRKKGYNIKHILLIGSGPLAKEYLEAVHKNKTLGFSVMGYLSSERGLLQAKHLGNYNQTEELLEEYNPDEVVIALEAEDFQLLPHMISSCEKAGAKICVIPFYSKYMPSKPYIDDIEGIPLINIRRIPLDNILNAILKRTVDIAGSLCLILMFSPIMAFAVIGTKISSPGPVIFKQKRVGLNKKLFIMYKFRSMKVNSMESIAWTTNTDSRKTKFGSWMRKCSIDELPQFFNVLKGDMSLVGPRPELPFFVEQFKESIPLYMVKHQVRPGITGWAQVNGYRGDTSIEKRIQHDIYYIENWTILFDIKILFKTLAKGLVNEEEV